MKTIGFLSLLIIAIPLTGQDLYKFGNSYDFAVSAGPSQFSGALSWTHLYGIGNGKKKFKAGYGLRLTSFFATDKIYDTAPSRLTSTMQNLGTIFSETIRENIDTIRTAKTNTNSLNATINLQYSLTSRLDVGFNIDAIGFSFGRSRSFNVISGKYDPGQPVMQPGSPTSFNLLLTSDNDIGSLNSELYVKYWITNKIALRAGYTLAFSEYTTDRNLSFDGGRIMNDRYRYKASMALLAITFQPFKK